VVTETIAPACVSCSCLQLLMLPLSSLSRTAEEEAGVPAGWGSGLIAGGGRRGGGAAGGERDPVRPFDGGRHAWAVADGGSWWGFLRQD
jgi:hypothetical protein